MKLSSLQFHFWIIFLLVGLTTCTRDMPEPTPFPTAIPPESIPEKKWAISYQARFEPEFWSVGEHKYRFQIDCPIIQVDDPITNWVIFSIKEDADTSFDPVYLRINGIGPGVLGTTWIGNFQPEKESIAVVTVFMPLEKIDVESCEIEFQWDDQFSKSLDPGEPYRP